MPADVRGALAAEFVTGSLNLSSFGTTGTADDSAVFQQALDASARTKRQLIVPAGTYVVDDLTMTESASMTGAGAGPFLFGTTGVILKHKAGSTRPALTILGGGVSIRSVTFDGNEATGDVLVNAGGFETRLQYVRVVNGGGVGFRLASDNNGIYQHVMVDNCGSPTSPAVLIASDGKTINTLDFYSLHIERSKGVQLQIGRPGDPVVPEFLKFYSLHIESGTSNGGVDNDQPLVVVKSYRSIEFIAPFLFAGPAPALQVEQTDSQSFVGGLSVRGGTMLGKPNAAKPERLVDVVSGSQIAIEGVRFDSTLYGAIRAAAAAGPDLRIGAGNIFTAATGGEVEDNRTGARKATTIHGTLTTRGHLASSGAAPAVVVAPANGEAPPAPTVAGTDTRGVVYFGSGEAPSAGPQVSLTFDRPYDTQPVVVLTGATEATASLGLYVAPSTSGFVVYSRNAPAAGRVVGAHQVQYAVLG